MHITIHNLDGIRCSMYHSMDGDDRYGTLEFRDKNGSEVLLFVDEGDLDRCIQAIQSVYAEAEEYGDSFKRLDEYV